MELPVNKAKISGSVKTIKNRSETANGSTFYMFTIDKPPEYNKFRNEFNNHLLTVKRFSDLSLKIGDFVDLEGFLKKDSYGYYFDCKDKVSKSLIVTEAGFINFLKTFKGLGPKKIEIVLSLYQENISNSKKSFLTDVFNENDNIVKALGKNLFLKLKRQVDEMPEELINDKEQEFIQEFDLKPGLVNCIKKNNENVIEVFKENIYQIAYKRKYKRQGFLSIDKIAKRVQHKLEIPDETFKEMRLSARIYFVLLAAEKDGHAFLRYNGVRYFLKELKIGDIEEDYFNYIVKVLLEAGEVIEEDKRYYLKGNYDKEVAVRNNVRNRMKQPSIDLKTKEFDFGEGFTPSEMQKLAIDTALKSNIMVLTGGPGTGKTTIAKYIYQELSETGLDIMLMAPTGTAARRISQVIGCSATTIHRGIKYNGSKAKFNQSNPLKVDVLMIDERSMIDLRLREVLLKAIKYSTKIIFIGDIDQLPAVGVGSVLEDLQKAKVDTVRLDRVYRQRESNPIVDFAYDVNNKKVNYFGFLTKFPKLDKKLNIYIKKSFLKKDNEETYTLNMQDGAIDVALGYYEMFDIMDVCILTQLRQGKKGTSQSINRKIQREINLSPFIPETIFKVGDKVMQTKNNYDKEIFNGSIGKIREYIEEENKVIIDFIDGDKTFEVTYLVPIGKTKSIEDNNNIIKNLDLAYAMTIHKSQGQEFKAVVLLVNNYFFINKKMIYTGITRAREKATVISNYTVINHGIETEFGIKEIAGKLVEVKRNTSLSDKIIQEAKKIK